MIKIRDLAHPLVLMIGGIVAHRLGVRFDGLWSNGAMHFHDYQTGSSFTATSLKNAKIKQFGLWMRFFDSAQSRRLHEFRNMVKEVDRGRHADVLLRRRDEARMSDDNFIQIRTNPTAERIVCALPVKLSPRRNTSIRRKITGSTATEIAAVVISMCLRIQVQNVACAAYMRPHTRSGAEKIIEGRECWDTSATTSAMING